MTDIALKLRLTDRPCLLVGSDPRLQILAARMKSAGSHVEQIETGSLAVAELSADTLVLIGTRNKQQDDALRHEALQATAWVYVLDRDDNPFELLSDLPQDAAGDTQAPRGEAYLIGAGPGDPELITLRGLRLLRQADVVLYDRLVAPGVVALVREDAELVYVGKRRDEHTVPQESINTLLIEYARQGKRVARLKGGDPFIFGRGGEELERLMDAGIPFQVVPGITAASGCAAYAGIPLTHRDYAQSVVFVTGHRQHGRVEVDYPSLVSPGQTVVFYMGLAGLGELCEGLISHGLSPATPAALVQHGTTVTQRVLVGTVGNLNDIALREKPRAPTLVIVGEVVRLRRELAWFSERGTEDSGFWQE